MYQIVLACKGVPTHAGVAGARDISKEFAHRPWHAILENFQPFLARTKKKPYPAELERLGCLVWKLRTKVTGEPLERNYVAGCRGLGY
jgi:hypothetical protein